MIGEGPNRCFLLQFLDLVHPFVALDVKSLAFGDLKILVELAKPAGDGVIKAEQVPLLGKFVRPLVE